MVCFRALQQCVKAHSCKEFLPLPYDLTLALVLSCGNFALLLCKKFGLLSPIPHSSYRNTMLELQYCISQSLYGQKHQVYFCSLLTYLLELCSKLPLNSSTNADSTKITFQIQNYIPSTAVCLKTEDLSSFKRLRGTTPPNLDNINKNKAKSSKSVFIHYGLKLYIFFHKLLTQTFKMYLKTHLFTRDLL